MITTTEIFTRGWGWSKALQSEIVKQETFSMTETELREYAIEKAMEFDRLKEIYERQLLQLQTELKRCTLPPTLTRYSEPNKVIIG